MNNSNLGNGTLTNPVLGSLGQKSGESFFQGLIPSAVGLVFVVGTITFFFMFILGAIQWIASGGDKQALEGARSKITSALVGVTILFISFALIRFLQRFFGISILTIDIGSLVIQ